jgi:aryl-alcohol dehydrogenase-like predicted oxidoreductase
MNRRRIGQTDLWVSPVAMGCWPIAGITSIDVTEANSLATIQAALDAGINFFDTAYCYGHHGESEQMVGRVLRPHRKDVVIATKCGIGWGPDLKNNSRTPALRQFAANAMRVCSGSASTRSISTTCTPLIPPRPSPIQRAPCVNSSTRARLRAVGVSNFSKIEQYEAFHAVCPISADQPHYNMLQTRDRSRTASLVREAQCVGHGLLAADERVSSPGNSHAITSGIPKTVARSTRSSKVTSGRRPTTSSTSCAPSAASHNRSLAELVTAWTIQRPGITVALCGAKRPDQIQESAAAMTLQLTAKDLADIDQAIRVRGEVQSRAAVT